METELQKPRADGREFGRGKRVRLWDGSICGRIPAAEAAQRRRRDQLAMKEDFPLPFDLPAVARKKVSTAFVLGDPRQFVLAAEGMG